MPAFDAAISLLRASTADAAETEPLQELRAFTPNNTGTIVTYGADSLLTAGDDERQHRGACKDPDCRKTARVDLAFP
jgi:hypothetical protein